MLHGMYHLMNHHLHYASQVWQNATVNACSLITDQGTEFDRIPPGYQGQLYAEICPRSFSVLVRPGMRLNQIRFRSGQAILSDSQLLELHKAETLVNGPAIIDDGLGFSVDLNRVTAVWSDIAPSRIRA